MLETDPLLSFNIFAANATYIDDTYGESPASPGAENYENGFEPLQTLPATWYNSLLKKLTKQAQFTKTLCDSIYSELCSVIADGNVALDDASVVNLRTALHNLFDLQIAGALTLGGVLSSAAPNKVLVNADGTMTPNALADWTTEYGTVKTQIDNILGGSGSSIASLAAAIAAINQNIGDLTALTTTAKNTIVAAINEVDGDVGALANLSTDSKSNVVAAINEVDSHADANNATIGVLANAINDYQPDSTTPQVVQVQTASPGSSTHAARVDHKHAVMTEAASEIGLAQGDVSWGYNAAGTKTTLARADHTHQLNLQTADTARYGVVQTTDLPLILGQQQLPESRAARAQSIRDLIGCIGTHSQRIAPQGSSYVSFVTITLTTVSERSSYQIFSVASAEYVGTAGYLLVWKGPGETTYSSSLIGLGTTSGCDIYYHFTSNNLLVIGSSDVTPISVTALSLFGYGTIITNLSGSTGTGLASGTKICENYTLRQHLDARDVLSAMLSLTSASVTSTYASSWVITFPDQGDSIGVWDLTVLPRIPGTPCVLRVQVAGENLLLNGIAASYIMAPSGVNCHASASGRVLTIAFNNTSSVFYQLAVQIKKVLGNGNVTAHIGSALTSGQHVIFVGEEADIAAHTVLLQG